MFLNYNRTIEDGGSYFAEPDFFVSNVLFYNATKMSITLDYRNQGFGVLISKNGFEEESKLENAYGVFFTEDTMEFVRYFEGERTILRRDAYRIPMPQEDFKIDVYKNGDYLYVSHEGKNILYHSIDKGFASYGFGFYVNQWNTVKDIVYRSNTPQEWDLNVISSQGGKAQFYKDGFSIIDARTEMQIEQSRIALPAGNYFLTYDEVPINDEFDIECFVYESDNPALRIEDKNILDGNKLTVSEDKEISVHFRGKRGGIENISIKKYLSLPYVSTDGISSKKDGSFIEIDMSIIKEMELSGKIDLTAIVDNLGQKRDYYYVKHMTNEWREKDTLLREHSMFDMVLTGRMLTIFNKTDKTKKEITMPIGDDFLYLLYNMDVVITKFKVTYHNGKTLDYLNQHTEKFYVPSGIKSPIIAIDNYYEPLDLSAAYRRVETDSRIYYLFTNTEREFFEGPYRLIHLSKALRLNDPQVVVYGIKRKASLNIESLYDIKEGYDDIRIAAPAFDVMHPDSYIIDSYASQITIKKAYEGLYEGYVIDYLKERSYAVNFDEELGVYEVDISHSDNTRVMYDYGDDGSVRQYISTGAKPDDDKYLVLSL